MTKTISLNLTQQEINDLLPRIPGETTSDKLRHALRHAANSVESEGGVNFVFAESTTPRAPEVPRSPKPHQVKPWQGFCTDCGTPNREYRNETKCRDCNMPTGSVESVKSINNCPFCGKTLVAVPTTDEAEEKVRTLLRGR